MTSRDVSSPQLMMMIIIIIIIIASEMTLKHLKKYWTDNLYPIALATCCSFPPKGYALPRIWVPDRESLLTVNV